MSADMLFRGVRFEAELASATLESGAQIRFTRRERALLSHLIQHPAKLLSREVILGVLAGRGLEMSNRNIDFLVNRLRRKLNDSPRSPRFIATRYGEGYVWVAPAQADARDPGERTFLGVGPVLGMRLTGIDAKAMVRELTRLREALERRFDPPRTIVVRFGEAGEQERAACDYVLQISILKLRRQLKAHVALRDGFSGYIFHTWQIKLSSDLRPLRSSARGFVDAVHLHIVEASIFTPANTAQAAEIPLDLALDQAAELFPTLTGRHRRISRMLHARLKSNPDDHQAGILLAVSQHVAMVRGHLDEFEGSLAEMERLLLTHRAGVQDNPLCLSAAAKLLYFVGHRRLAMELAAQALDRGTSHAASLMVVGQIALFEGDLDHAVECFDQAITFCEKETRFHSMLLLLKASAMRVVGDMTSVRQLAKEIVGLDASQRLVVYANLLGDDTVRDRQTAGLAKAISLARWQQMLRHLYYVNARLFVQERHRERMLGGLAHLAVSHVGSACLIDEMQRSAPMLCESYARVVRTV